MATRYVLGGIKTNVGEIGGITDVTFDNGIQAVLNGSGGAVDNTYAAMLYAEPLLRFTSTDIFACLGQAGISGTSLSSWIAAFQLATNKGTRTGTWRQLTGASALLVPVSIQAAQGREATIEMAVYPIGDATNAPVGINTSDPSVTQVSAKKYTLGPLELNTAAIEIQSIRIDMNYQIERRSHSGLPWPTHVNLNMRAPKITFTSIDAEKLAAVFGTNEVAETITALEVWLYKMAEGGAARVALATEEHIKFTGTEGIAYMTSMGGSRGGDAVSEYQCDLVYDGSNAVLAFDTTAAIA
ncbi:MAG: hypothetical protein AMXMBFR84_37850 [Candidatus Hydrogenedentota bacterium]